MKNQMRLLRGAQTGKKIQIGTLSKYHVSCMRITSRHIEITWNCAISVISSPWPGRKTSRAELKLHVSQPGALQNRSRPQDAESDGRDARIVATRHEGKVAYPAGARRRAESGFPVHPRFATAMAASRGCSFCSRAITAASKPDATSAWNASSSRTRSDTTKCWRKVPNAGMAANTIRGRQ